MRALLSKRVITVAAEDRAADVSELIRTRDASHCVVVEKPSGEFVGVVRLRELAAKPVERIFADLLSSLPTLRVNNRATSEELLAQLQRAKLKEAVVLTLSGSYIGLVTQESLRAWKSGLIPTSTKSTLRKPPPPGPASTLSRKVREQATALNEVLAQLDEFSYAMSHDIRTPLRAVRGYALTLQEEYGAKLDETARDYLRRIVRASDRLERLTLGVMAYREITHATVKIRKLDTKLVVAEALSFAAKSFPRAEITVNGTLPKVRADRSLLLNCFSQLLENAVKFTPAERTPKIRLFAEQSAGQAMLCVEDEGMGIRPAHQERIFQLFERVNGSETDGGFGLGLAVVRKSIERMGGKISVTSDLQRGSCFRITLPKA